MRILGLDVGDKTIGVAVSDGLGLTAQGVTTIRRRSYDKDLELLAGYIDEYEVGKVVVGLPKNMDGSLGPQAEKAINFADRIRERLGIDVSMYDERLSTLLVQKAMIEADVSRAKRKKVVDMLAAQVILQGYLDRNRPST
jgi:putative pre-16S rRNA nuclease